MIFWNDAPAIDGAFILAIHPSHIILRSMHENPNPDFVYWNLPITDAQYKAIIQGFRNYRGHQFSDKDVWVWPGYKVFRFTDSRESPWCPELASKRSHWETERTSVLNDNVERVFAVLNSFFRKDTQRLHAPRAEVSAPFALIDNGKSPNGTLAKRR